MDASDPDRPAAPVVVAAPTDAKPEIKEKPAEGTPSPAEIDATHESGYGFGV